MSFKSGFKQRERVNVAGVRRKRIPEFGSRATESSAPHCTETGRGVDREGGSNEVGMSGDVEEIR